MLMYAYQLVQEPVWSHWNHNTKLRPTFLLPFSLTLFIYSLCSLKVTHFFIQNELKIFHDRKCKFFSNAGSGFHFFFLISRLAYFTSYTSGIKDCFHCVIKVSGKLNSRNCVCDGLKIMPSSDFTVLSSYKKITKRRLLLDKSSLSCSNFLLDNHVLQECWKMLFFFVKNILNKPNFRWRKCQ